MRSSWVGSRLLLSCALLLGLVEFGKCRQQGEPSFEEEFWRERHPQEDTEHSQKRHPHPKELEEAGLAEIEHSELSAQMKQEYLASRAAQSLNMVPYIWKEFAVEHYNHHTDGLFYRHLEDDLFHVQKAIGIMVRLQVILAKTNCTKDEEQEAGVEYSRAYLERKGCQLLPESTQEKRHCLFDIFVDLRSDKKSVIYHYCDIMPTFGDQAKEDV